LDFFKDVTDIRDIVASDIKIPEEILDQMPKYAYGGLKEHHLKNAYNQAGMYAFVSWRWINPFVEWLADRKVLEVMAGRGWWTYALRQKGVNVIATDDFSWMNRSWIDTLTEVEEVDAIEAVERYGKEVDVVTNGLAIYG